MKFSPEAQARWNNEFNRIELMCAPLQPLYNYRDYDPNTEHARLAEFVEALVQAMIMYQTRQCMQLFKLHVGIYSVYLFDEQKIAYPKRPSMQILDGWLNNNKSR